VNLRLLRQLEALVGADHVLTRPEAIAPYLADWRGRYRGQALGVVLPADAESVAAVVRVCTQEGIALVPQGGNTGLCGGAVALAEIPSVVINLSRLNRIRSVDPLDNTLCAEAGCTLSQIQTAAEAADRLYPLSLASEGSCELGGNISTNAGGVHVLRYGSTRDLVLGLEVVLADGRIWHGLRGLRKDNTGYDLKQLFIGAEGTLGVVTAATLKLFPRPRGRSLAWVGLASSEAALDVLAVLRGACGDRLTAFELVGEEALDLVLRHIPAAHNPLPGHGGWSALVELTDTVANGGLDTLLQDCLAHSMAAGQVTDVVLASSIGQINTLWALRENIAEAQRIEGFSIKHDIAIPVGRIPGFLRQAGRALEAGFPGLRIVVFGHLGDGNLHYNLSLRDTEANRGLLARSEEISRLVHDLVHGQGGSISAEHGIGLLKRAELGRYKSSVELELMRRVKTALDPANLMNPGKVLPD
jgi:FAD/FMN-containing dehydrogenase